MPKVCCPSYCLPFSLRGYHEYVAQVQRDHVDITTLPAHSSYWGHDLSSLLQVMPCVFPPLNPGSDSVAVQKVR